MARTLRPARNRKFKAIAIDVDGTMVGPDLVVSGRLRNAISAAKVAGAVVSVATGRMMRSALRFARDSGATGPVICYQGAMTFVPDTGEVLRHERLAPEAATAALDEFGRHDLQVNLYLDDEVYVEGVNEWAEAYATRMEIKLKVVPSLRPLALRRPTLILAVGDKELVSKLIPSVVDRLGTYARVTHSLPHFCEVGSLNAGKEQALEHLSTLLKIPSSEFIAFGDGRGDVEMLRWAGLGVAMEGGQPEAIAASDVVAPGPQDDGVAIVLEKLLSEGRIGR